MTSSPRAVLTSWIMLMLWASKSTCAPVPPAGEPSAAAQCSPQNRNPCETFPALCSTGGGRCVAKEPCEYQCLCPDGRLGRDCSRSSNPDPGSVVDSLLIFPKDIFADVNHVSKSEMFANSDKQNVTAATTPQLETTPGVSMSTAETRTTTKSPSLETTRALAPELAANNLAPLSNTTYSTIHQAETTATTLGVDTSVKIILTTPVPSHTETVAGSLVSKSSTENLHPAPGNSQAWDSSAPTGNPTEASSPTQQPTQQPTTSTLTELDHPSSNVLLLLNLSATPGDSAQMMPTNVGSSKEPQPVMAGNSSMASTDPKAGAAQVVGSSRPEVSTSSQAEIIHTSITHSVILSHDLTSPSASTAPVQPQQETTQQHHTSTTTPTTNSPFSRTQYGSTSSQQTTSTASGSTVQSTAAAEEFPTLFKLTLDNQLNPMDTGKNSALSMVVHRVFVPIEKFQPAQKSAP